MQAPTEPVPLPCAIRSNSPSHSGHGNPAARASGFGFNLAFDPAGRRLPGGTKERIPPTGETILPMPAGPAFPAGAARDQGVLDFPGAMLGPMDTGEIRARYLSFFAARGHAIIPRAPIVPREDPTTLFTGSGMQPLLPYLLGTYHQAGDRLVNSQTCFRAEDIDEIGDNRHT